METEIRQYIRDSKGIRNGVLVARKNGDVVRVAWSACNKRDKFEVKTGLRIAYDRLFKGTNANIPYRVNFLIVRSFMDRCKRYFKTENVVYATSRGD